MSHHMPLHTNTEATQNEHREREADHPSECSEPSEQTCHGDKPVRDRREKFEHTRDTLDSTPKTSNHEQRKNTPAARFGNPKPGTRKRHAASSTQEAKQDGKRTRQPFDGKERLYEVIKVRLVRSQRLIEVNTNEKKIMPNMTVLVRVHRNVLLATTIGHRYRRVAEINALPYILRHANAQDVEIDRQNQAIEKRAQELATTYALDHALQMKVLSADLSHDHKNITINFASDVRVDFREMVAFLASHLKLHVEMYQLGLRNGTGLICGLGSCGQRLCCGRFLGQFDPVAVKRLRAQGLATNPKRISGVCGRLYCCLSYEYGDGLKERRAIPKKGRRVLTRRGLGRVIDQDMLREEILVIYDTGETQRLSHNDFIPANDDILADIDAGKLEFPLEPAKFYLNRDPASACDNAPSLPLMPAPAANRPKRTLPAGNKSTSPTQKRQPPKSAKPAPHTTAPDPEGKSERIPHTEGKSERTARPRRRKKDPSRTSEATASPQTHEQQPRKPKRTPHKNTESTATPKRTESTPKSTESTAASHKNTDSAMPRNIRKDGESPSRPPRRVRPRRDLEPGNTNENANKLAQPKRQRPLPVDPKT